MISAWRLMAFKILKAAQTPKAPTIARKAATRNDPLSIQSRAPDIAEGSLTLLGFCTSALAWFRVLWFSWGDGDGLADLAGRAAVSTTTKRATSMRCFMAGIPRRRC